MKKTIIVLAAIFVLVACNSGVSTEAPKTDSTTVVDSTKVDSVAAAADTCCAPAAEVK